MGDAKHDDWGELRLDALPSLPQAGTIRSTATRLWADQRVRAIWLGGSLAGGTGDEYSDIDLRIAVAPDDLAAWESPDFAALIESPVLGRHFVRFGTGSFLHHLVLGNGDILNFLVYSGDAEPGSEPLLVLACRDAMLAEKLAAADHLPEQAETPVTGEAIRELLIAFWINSHKHRKVLHQQSQASQGAAPQPRSDVHGGRVRELDDADAPLVHRRDRLRHQPAPLLRHPRADRAGARRRGRVWRRAA